MGEESVGSGDMERGHVERVGVGRVDVVVAELMTDRKSTNQRYRLNNPELVVLQTNNFRAFLDMRFHFYTRLCLFLANAFTEFCCVFVEKKEDDKEFLVKTTKLILIQVAFRITSLQSDFT